jgi:predicted MFS family arabinose efflux permease
MGGLVLAVGLAVVAATLPPFLTGAFAVRLRAELPIRSGQLALAVSAFFVVTAGCAPFAGRLCDRAGWRRTLLVGVCGSAISLVGLATTARGDASLAGWLAVGGLANAVVVPAAGVAVSRGVSKPLLGRAVGLTQAAVPITGIIAGVAVPSSLATIGWRWSYAASGIVPVLAGGALARLHAGTRPPEETSGPPPGGSSPDNRRQLVLLALSGALGTTLVTGLASSFVVLTVDDGTTVSTAGLLLALGGTVGAAVRIASGWLPGVRARPSAGIVVGLQIVAATGFAALATRQPQLLVPGTVLAFAGGWGWPSAFNHVLLVRYADQPGAATGFVLTGLATGAIVGPPLLAHAVDVGSPTAAWWSACGLGLAAAAISAAAAAAMRRSPRPAEYR